MLSVEDIVTVHPSRKTAMDARIECKDCQLAVYCYSEENTWVFRTTQEMEEKKVKIAQCPIYQGLHGQGSPAS